jgi:hypothetical protein
VDTPLSAWPTSGSYPPAPAAAR